MQLLFLQPPFLDSLAVQHFRESGPHNAIESPFYFPRRYLACLFTSCLIERYTAEVWRQTGRAFAADSTARSTSWASAQGTSINAKDQLLIYFKTQQGGKCLLSIIIEPSNADRNDTRSDPFDSTYSP